VSTFIEENPDQFLYLQRLLQDQHDLIEIMREFYGFLGRKGFDEKFSEGRVFESLCEEARSAIARKA
jgi:hypothetical protein